jgi:hypothetical protein
VIALVAREFFFFFLLSVAHYPCSSANTEPSLSNFQDAFSRRASEKEVQERVTSEFEVCALLRCGPFLCYTNFFCYSCCCCCWCCCCCMCLPRRHAQTAQRRLAKYTARAKEHAVFISPQYRTIQSLLASVEKALPQVEAARRAEQLSTADDLLWQCGVDLESCNNLIKSV